MDNIGYLHFGSSPGPMRTQSVPVKHNGLAQYQALYEGRWRKVYIQVRRTFIAYMGERITIQIEGV
jgi:hypothetical protein